jgi:hypothetical protein
MLPDEFKRRIAFFPRSYMDNFDYVWKWKIKVESDDSAHILDENHKKEAYFKLCTILPKWQTYRNGDNSEPLETLRKALDNISEEYNKLRKYTLLDFDSIPFEALENIWHELGRVKEKDGNRNKYGYYSVISVCKPLLLMWGQTLAFDALVRKHLPSSYNVSKYSCNWNLTEWIRIMKQFSKSLNINESLMKFMSEESEKRYRKNAIIPYGRFLDIFYWVGYCCSKA